MGKAIIYSLRAVQATLAVTSIGLSAYLINWYLTRTRFSSPNIFNFHLVAPIISLLTILYLELTPIFAPRALHAFAALGLEALNTIFYFSGFIALATFLSELVFCNGPQCAAGHALVGISAASFVAWVVTTALVAKDIFKGGLRAPSAGGSWGKKGLVPSAAPMAQV
ncbi:hypothetical protein NLU13_7051 [Sarocladium strictum]|uniref:MARVEL domain-containing protein n=1 Tax=Sarocladium strictum TaxID=5046 RepID=A0AA39GF90_SARSR|nr:hypothetical protein NLU13_7051 [Sarocladium strictum]